MKSTTHIRLVAVGLLVCCLAGVFLAWKMRDSIDVSIEVDRQATSLRAATPETQAPVPQKNTTTPATDSMPSPNPPQGFAELPPPIEKPVPDLAPPPMNPLPVSPPAAAAESVPDNQAPQANLLQPVPAPPFRDVPEDKPVWNQPSVPVSSAPSTGSDKPEPGAVPPSPGVSATAEPPLATLKPTPTAQPQAVIVPASFTAIRPAAASVARVAVRDKMLPLTGTHSCKLDDGRRLTLPKEVREQLGEAPALFFTPGPDQCLWLCTAAGLEKRMEQADRSSADDAQARARRRLYFSQTEKSVVKWDQSGECQIPERLVQFAELRQEVVLVGVGDHFELWDTQRWQQYVQQNTAAPARVAPRAEK